MAQSVVSQFEYDSATKGTWTQEADRQSDRDRSRGCWAASRYRCAVRDYAATGEFDQGWEAEEEMISLIDRIWFRNESGQMVTRDHNIGDMEISVALNRALTAAGIKYRELKSMTDDEILAVRGIGKKGLRELRNSYSWPPMDR